MVAGGGIQSKTLTGCLPVLPKSDPGTFNETSDALLQASYIAGD
jgi:hypothetical protein